MLAINFKDKLKMLSTPQEPRDVFFFHWQHATYTVCSQKRLVEQHPSLILFDIIILFMIYEQALGSQDLSSCWRRRGGWAAVVAGCCTSQQHWHAEMKWIQDQDQEKAMG